MSATVQLPAHPWASAHRALLTVLAIVLALTVALAISLVVSRATADDPLAPPTFGEVEIVPDGCQHALPGTAC
jgi:hypothetical protein